MDFSASTYVDNLFDAFKRDNFSWKMKTSNNVIPNKVVLNGAPKALESLEDKLPSNLLL